LGIFRKARRFRSVGLVTNRFNKCFQTCLSAKARVEVDSPVGPIDQGVVLLEPGGSKDEAVLAYVGDKEVDPLMVCSNTHGDMGGLSRDGAGINRSSIRNIKVDWIEEFGSRDVEFVDQGLIDEALGGS
jgi:hypothetical protein